MPVIHGRSLDSFPRVLANCREHFTEDEITSDMLADGAWSVTISRAGWMRVWDNRPEMRPAAVMIGRLAHS